MITIEEVLCYQVTAPHMIGSFIVYEGRVASVSASLEMLQGCPLLLALEMLDDAGWLWEQVNVVGCKPKSLSD